MKYATDYILLTEAQLIDLLKDGNRRAYTEIYNRHHELLIVFAYKKLQDEELAKDIVQDIFIKLWVQRETLNIRSNLPGYLITSIKHAIFSALEHEEVCAKYISSMANYANTGEIAHTDFLLREREWQQHIDHAIETLPPKMREAFILHKKEHLSYTETAKKLNTTENNIQKHINGAIRILRTKLTIFF